MVHHEEADLRPPVRIFGDPEPSDLNVPGDAAAGDVRLAGW